MKIAGFTIIKNAVVNDFPIVEAIRSILPVVDEMIVLVGDSTITRFLAIDPSLLNYNNLAYPPGNEVMYPDNSKLTNVALTTPEVKPLRFIIISMAVAA